MKEVIIKLTLREANNFISIVRRAFADDPLFIKLFANAENDTLKKSQTTAFLHFLFMWSYYRDDLLLGVYKNNKLTSVALVEVKKRFSIVRFFKYLAVIPSLINLLFKLPLNKGQFLNKYFLQTRRVMPSTPYYYLTMLATLPTCQGEGKGKYLISYIKNLAEQDGSIKGVGLDTENPQNIEWYESLGFTLIDSYAIEDVSVFSLYKVNCNNS